MGLAPAVLFAFKRPLHTKATLDALSANVNAQYTKLYVFIDGLKPGVVSDDFKNHQEVIDLVNTYNWPGEKEVFVSDVNKGLATSVVDGVSFILDKHKRIIVLEDDLVTSVHFLEYMNQALDKYENSNEVACISGYVYPLKQKFDSAYFVKGADCWGWATWDTKWKSVFDNNPSKLLKQLTEQKLLKQFNFNDSYPYETMLKDRVYGKNQSWAIVWYASAFLKNKLCLYPAQSLVHNIGNDGSGTHTELFTDKFDADYYKAKMPLLPNNIAESEIARNEFEIFFRDLTGNKKQTIVTKFKHKIKSIFGL